MRSLVALVGGLTLLVLGGALFVTADGAADFGWFAYAPLDEGSAIALSGGAVVLSRGQWMSLGPVVLGTTLLAGAVGYRLGVRRAAE